MTMKNVLMPHWFACGVICFLALMFFGGVNTVADMRTSNTIWEGECPVVWDSGGLKAVCAENHIIPVSINATNVEKMLTGVELKCQVTSNFIFPSKGRCD